MEANRPVPSGGSTEHGLSKRLCVSPIHGRGNGGGGRRLGGCPGRDPRAVARLELHRRMTKRTILICLSLAACTSTPSELCDDRLIDLTHPFDENTIYWPTAKRFELVHAAWGPNDQGLWYASNDLSASEHGGTHLDAPIHFARGGRDTASIPIGELVGPARVVDVREACERDRDYRVTPADIRAHEASFGPIPEGAIVLIHTGWGRFWPDAKLYLGSDVPGDASDLHFPGLSSGAADLLVERGVDVVGIDTASLDHGQSTHFLAHRVLGAANVAGLENVANVGRLPASGATLIALPMKIAGGTGGPCRVVALLP
ncbi:MAG: cyclase [Planctomycetes bacterium]|nr:cyclase [Planctomycetota bacterium]